MLFTELEWGSAGLDSGAVREIRPVCVDGSSVDGDPWGDISAHTHTSTQPYMHAVQQAGIITADTDDIPPLAANSGSLRSRARARRLFPLGESPC